MIQESRRRFFVGTIQFNEIREWLFDRPVHVEDPKHYDVEDHNSLWGRRVWFIEDADAMEFKLRFYGAS